MFQMNNQIRGRWVFLAAVLLFTSGCGPRETAQAPEPGQEISIYYHADDGTFDGEAYHVAPKEDLDSAVEKGKTVITFTVCSLKGYDSVYRQIANQFNNESEQFYVELTDCDYGDELRDMRTRISIEMGSGRGPDLLTEDIFPLSQEIMDSGVLVDLTPYLEASGITPEKYFPGYAAAVSGDKIYGVDPKFMVINYWVDEEVLGSREAPDLETLVDKLLEYPERASFLGPGMRSRYILAYFLEGSEDLWGMIDWEEKTCDFTGDLFSKILEVTKRYWEDGEKGYDPVMYSFVLGMTTPISRSQSFYPGTVSIGFYFDDGSHPKYQVNGDIMMINANTQHLEGAYAFLSYVLCKSGQSFSVEPVHKEVWEATLQVLMVAIEEGRSPLPLYEETRKEALATFEDARFAPRRAETILEIVYEEAESYFEGDRSREEVIGLIQNRVQLYLNENK